MSHNPGIKNFPVASTTCASFGTRTLLVGPSSVIRSPTTTNVISSLAGAPLASITVTWVKASGIDCGCCFGWTDTRPGSITKSNNVKAFFIVTLRSGVISSNCVDRHPLDQRVRELDVYRGGERSNFLPIGLE